MSIIIKGMKMPKGNSVKCIRIFPDGKVSNIYDSDRKQIATAFPVPPHGRLVDADVLEAEPCDVVEDRGWYDVFGYSQALIRNVPTIIDAEEEDNGN